MRYVLPLLMLLLALPSWAAAQGTVRIQGDPLGQNADAAVTPGDAGSITGKLRQLSADVDALADSLGAAADATVAAGATGTAQAKLRRLTEDLGAALTALQTLAGAVSGTEQQVDVLTLPADPLGASADAVVNAGDAGSISAKLRRLTADLAGVLTALGATSDAAVTPGAVGTVSGKLRQVSGDLDAIRTALEGTLAVSAASLPLPTGAATAAAQTDGSQRSMVRGAARGSTTATDATVTALDADRAPLDVYIRGGGASGGTAIADNQPFTGGSTAGTPGFFLYDTTPPPMTDGNTGLARMDSSRRLIIACESGCGGSGGTAQNDRTTFTDGSGSATPIAGVFNDTPSDPTEDQAAAVRITGKRAMHMNLRDATGAERGTAGSPLRIDPTGTTTQPVSIPGTVTVTGTTTANIGTTNGLALDATVGRAQGSATSGQTGPLVQGAVSTNAPSYTTAQTNPLSLTPAGELRVLAATGLSDRTASGSIAGSAQSVAISLQGLQGVSFTAAGTWTAVLRCQVTSDGSSWVDVDSWSPAVEAVLVDVSANGTYSCVIPAGMAQARVFANQYSSGTATITLRATAAPGRIFAESRPDGQSLPNHTLLIGGSDGTNLRSLRVFDVDSAGGTTQFVAGVSLRKSNSGGSVELGTSSDPVRTDPTGTTTQPVSGTVAVTQATASNLNAQVQGAAASGATAAGNPVQGGAVFRTTQPTVTNGQVVENQATARGALIVATGADTFAVDSELPAAGALADGASNPTTTTVGAVPSLFNGSTLDRARAVTNGMNTTGTGVAAAGILGQLDDTSPGAVTENQFAPVRITPARGLHVVLYDDAGSPVAVGGGTQYDRDTAAGAADKLTMAGAVRSDAGGSLVGADGDRTPLSVDASGALRVTGGGGGTEYTQDAAAPANPTGNTLMMVRDDALATLTPAEGDWNVLRSTSRGALWVAHDGALAVTGPLTDAELRATPVPVSGTITANAGTGTRSTNLIQVGGNAVDSGAGNKSSGTLRVTLPDDQTWTGATNLGKAEDAAAGSGDVGVAGLLVREDTPTSTASANGDYIHGKANAHGHQFVAAICNDPTLTVSVPIAQTALNGNAELVALTTNQVVYVCGFSVISSGAANVRLVYGTGTACATGETGLTGAYPLVANSGISVPNGGAIQMKGAASNAVCIETSASVNLAGHLTYAKFQP